MKISPLLSRAHSRRRCSSLLAVPLLVALAWGSGPVLAQGSSPAASGSTVGPVVEKVEAAVVRGAHAAASGIERGVKAAKHGVERGVQAAASGVERGAKATAETAEAVGRKVGGGSSSGSGSSGAASGGASAAGR